MIFSLLQIFFDFIMPIILEVGHTFAIFVWSNRDKPRETLIEVRYSGRDISLAYYKFACSPIIHLLSM